MEHVQQWAQLRVRLWREYPAEHHRDDAIRTCFFECSRARPGRKTIVTPDGQAYARARVRSDPALLKALARAFRWQRMLDEGRYASVTEMAAAEKIERGYLGRILRLALLAPDLVEAVLNGTQGIELSLRSLLEGCGSVGRSSVVSLNQRQGAPERARPVRCRPMFAARPGSRLESRERALRDGLCRPLRAMAAIPSTWPVYPKQTCAQAGLMTGLGG